MWHEARRQEKKIRGLMVDLKRRADRRREFYEKIKQDPTQFLRMYGRPVKIHLDPAVAMAAEGPQSMMAWQGDSSNMIDRFDVRANLDFITEYDPNIKSTSRSNICDDEERLTSYERYRTLVENEAAGLTEEQCLNQIYLDEHFGTINRSNEEEKKKNADKKAAIGYIYEDSTPVEKNESNENEEESDEDDLDMADLDVTIDVDSLTPDMCKEVSLIAQQYGMKDDDFVRLLRKDKEELEALKEARQLEEAKAQFSGRKSRRERRAINEKRQNPQRFCRPSYAARESPKYEPYKRPGSSSRSRSRSRSKSPEIAEVKFITSFGNDSDGEGVVQGPSLPASLSRKKKNPETSKCETPWLSHYNSESKKIASDSRSGRRRYSTRSSTSHSSSRSRSPRCKGHSPNRGRSLRRSHGRSGSRRYSDSSSKSRSRSKSRTPPSSRKEIKRSRSKSLDKLPIKRYRRESLSSSSNLSGLDSDEDDHSSVSSASRPIGSDQSKMNLTGGGKLTSKSIFSQGVKETPQERLKRRMQAQLNRQFRADKKAEITKISKQEQERLDREEEIKTMAIEMRRRERERRHKERADEENERRSRRISERSRSSSDSDSSKNSSRSSSPQRKSSDSENDAKDKRRSGSGGRGRYRNSRDGAGDGRRRESDNWVSRRESSGDSRRRESAGDGRYLDDDRRSWNGPRDDRRGWRDRDDRSYGGSRLQGRSETSQMRKRPLLHRPDSPMSHYGKSRHHPRE